MEEEGARDCKSLKVSRRCSDLSFLACVESLDQSPRPNRRKHLDKPYKIQNASASLKTCPLSGFRIQHHAGQLRCPGRPPRCAPL